MAFLKANRAMNAIKGYFAPGSQTTEVIKSFRQARANTDAAWQNLDRALKSGTFDEATAAGRAYNEAVDARRRMGYQTPRVVGAYIRENKLRAGLIGGAGVIGGAALFSDDE